MLGRFPIVDVVVAVAVTPFVLVFFFGGATVGSDDGDLFVCIDAETNGDFREVDRSLL